MTSIQVVETSVNVTKNSPSKDHTHPDDHNLPSYDMTAGFKLFTVRDKITFTVSVFPVPVGPTREPPQKFQIACLKNISIKSVCLGSPGCV